MPFSSICVLHDQWNRRDILRKSDFVLDMGTSRGTLGVLGESNIIYHWRCRLLVMYVWVSISSGTRKIKKKFSYEYCKIHRTENTSVSWVPEIKAAPQEKIWPWRKGDSRDWSHSRTYSLEYSQELQDRPKRLVLATDHMFVIFFLFFLLFFLKTLCFIFRKLKDFESGKDYAMSRKSIVWSKPCKITRHLQTSNFQSWKEVHWNLPQVEALLRRRKWKVMLLELLGI